MSLIRKCLDNIHYEFFCAGCKTNHVINETWIIKHEEATITPSVLTSGRNELGSTRCHLFVTKGKIQYLQDCTHELAGKTVDMVDAK